MSIPVREPLGAIDLNANDFSALDPELVKTLAAGGKIDLRQFRGNPEAMAAAKKALAMRAEKEKAEKLAAKEAAKAEKLAQKEPADDVAQMPLQDTGNGPAEMEVSFEVDHSTMKPLEN